MPAGPGGNVIGVNFANDGAAVCRTDTGGAYVNTIANPVWRMLSTLTSLPSGYATIMGEYYSGGVKFGGSYACAIAPTNSQIIYMLVENGQLFYSSDQGVNFSLTGFTPITVIVNAQPDSSWNNKIAIDPHNPAVVMVGCPTGTFYSTNSGGAFTATAIPAGTATRASLIAFDPSSWTSGDTPTVYASSHGNGIYRSTTGVSGTFTLLNSANMPTTASQMKIASDGTVYVVNASYALYKYSGGAWSILSPYPVFGSGYTTKDVFADPANSARVIAGGQTPGDEQSGLLSESLDRGVTWSAPTPGPLTTAKTATDVPWLATTSHNYFAGCEGDFNPALTNTLVFGEGTSVWTTNPFVITATASPYTYPATGNTSFAVTSANTISSITAGDAVQLFRTSDVTQTAYGEVFSYTVSTATTGTVVIRIDGGSGSGTHSDWTIRPVAHYTSQGAGINQLINNRVVVPPNGSPFVCSWDRCGLYLSSTTTFPAEQAFTGTSPEICDGWDADYASTNTSYLAGIFNSHGSPFGTSGFSTNGGLNWTTFGTDTPYSAGPYIAGSMAVAGNATTSAATQNIVWAPGSYASDNRPYYSVDGGATWALCSFPGDVPTSGTTGWGTWNQNNPKQVVADRVQNNTFYAYNTVTGSIYQSTNSGANWSKKNTTTPINTFGIKRLKSVDMLGSTNTFGWLFAMGITDNVSDVFIRSKDEGETWQIVTSSGTFTSVAAMGIGASVNGAVPAIMVVGIKGGTRGLYLSTDDCVTWTNVTGDFTSADQIHDVEGDKTNANVWYVATSTSGVLRGAESSGGVTTEVFAFSVIHGHAKRKRKMIGH